MCMQYVYQILAVFILLLLAPELLPDHQHGGEGGEKKTQESASCICRTCVKRAPMYKMY